MFPLTRESSAVRPLDIQSVRNWLFMNHPSAISTAESSFINHTDNLIAVQSKRKSPVRLFLESIPSDSLIVEPENYWTNDQRMEQFAGILILDFIGRATALLNLAFSPLSFDQMARRRPKS